MRVLVACECYGVVRDAFLRLGHDAWSCDLKDTRIPGPHIKGDVLDYLNEGWDLMIAHPDCTYLANSGVQHLHKEPGRWGRMEEAKEFFYRLKNCDIPRICIENPIPHKYGLGKTYSQIIHPWQFGHPESKAICLWLKKLKKLKFTNLVEGREQRIWKMSPGQMRKELRSVFFPGISWAMADQWG